MSTFSGLNTAYTGLSAARKGLDVVGQNIANVNTPGYTRQRVTTSAMGGAAITGKFATGARVGQGVSVDGIARLGSMQLDTRVRATAAASGFSAVRANALAGLEASLNEPGKNGISASLTEFWAAWQGVSNKPGNEAAATALIGQATMLATQVATGYQAVEEQWTGAYKQLKDMEAELNGTASQIASLNAQIRTTQASGGTANELIDQRNALTTTIAALAGGTVRESDNGMVDVLIDGNAIVSGDIVRPVQVAGGIAMGAEAPRLEWSHRPGINMAASGEIAGVLSVLAPAADGGILASAAEGYNNFARSLATAVNAVHNGGTNTAGTVVGDFFSHTTDPAALSLKVVPANASGIATGAVGNGNLDNSIADAIAQLGAGAGSPDSIWANFVSGIGASTRVEMQQADLAGVAASAAVGMQLSNSSVDLDEENLNLLAYQHAYQGAARVMTAIDEMLDTLINRTGIVGR
ncbi:flagellar hook-associated protein FlgK [Arthrobacter sp. zg-Y916]|uniref:flagellar hook-associated protein FlgK n=1 Tax=Arthrobacter sp. zg-Y916 TaxID=2894190 RepID=UPI001E2A97F8|nr:flagellar hook-associated protein FlgK [Arthrobacter sp. zg-Y916]MCC9195053.1 flagellar hook-associated protein FlgK [Arthrobacter sp. zg-Y916]